MGKITIIILLGINLVVGTWSIIEILSWFGKSIPLLGSVVLGLFAAEVSIPIAFVGYILRIFGIF